MFPRRLRRPLIFLFFGMALTFFLIGVVVPGVVNTTCADVTDTPYVNKLKKCSIVTVPQGPAVPFTTNFKDCCYEPKDGQAESVKPYRKCCVGLDAAGNAVDPGKVSCPAANEGYELDKCLNLDQKPPADEKPEASDENLSGEKDNEE